MHHVALETSDVGRRSGTWRHREPSWSTRSHAPASSGSKSHSSIPTPSTASSRRWFPLTSANDFVRIEIGLDGGQILSTLVTPKSADALEQSLQAGAAGSLALEAQEEASCWCSRASCTQSASRASRASASAGSAWRYRSESSACRTPARPRSSTPSRTREQGFGLRIRRREAEPRVAVIPDDHVAPRCRRRIQEGHSRRDPRRRRPRRERGDPW